MVISCPFQWGIFGCRISRSFIFVEGQNKQKFINLLVISLCVLCFSDDEDDTAELLAELQRIKKERAQEEAKKVWFLFLALG